MQWVPENLSVGRSQAVTTTLLNWTLCCLLKPLLRQLLLKILTSTSGKPPILHSTESNVGSWPCLQSKVLYHFKLFGQGCDLWPLGQTCITGQMQCDTEHGPKFSQPLVHGFRKNLWFNLQWYYASATFAVTQDKWLIPSISTGPVMRRECHRFWNLRVFRSQVVTGEGAGWQIVTLKKPAPVARVWQVFSVIYLPLSICIYIFFF